jgi:ubiquinone/menaquinone biosynthesis C-methylase UbiE
VFRRVIATDASEKQIANAQSREIVEYRVAPAENCGLGSETTDLIMVAQALHWFDLDHFYGEVRRVLKSDGVLAASAYNLLHIEKAIDEVVNRYYYEMVGLSGRRNASSSSSSPISLSRFKRSIRPNSK